MSEGRRPGLAPQLDIEKILLEAQQRWLRPAEICEILRNYCKFRIAPEPPNKPPSGSLFLFDRKVLRYFRKDGHNWRKKKDGKTVKEAHERLKAESVDVLHCYYAHGEENENFQRRSYWLLDEDFMHIVLVHYLEIKGNKASYSRSRDAQEVVQLANTSNPVSSNSYTNQSPQPSQTTDAESPNSTQTSEYEDAESDNYQRSTRYYPFPELPQYDGPVMDVGLSPCVSVSSSNQCDNQFVAAKSEAPFFPVGQDGVTKVSNESELGFAFNGCRSQVDFTAWGDNLESYMVGFPSNMAGFPSTSFHTSLETEAASFEEIPLRGSLAFDELYTDELCSNPVDVCSAQGKAEWQLSDSEVGSVEFSNVEGSISYPLLLKQQSLGISNNEEGGLKKYDSFSRWMSNELGEVDDSNIKLNSETYWNPVESSSVLEDSGMSNQDQLDAFLISPSLSQDQLFSISDFSPHWAYSGSQTEVLISGTFFKSRSEVENCKWSCMFGEVEVPAEILADGTLRCHAPPHRTGRVPFYVTCSNRLACSEVREFEFRGHYSQYMETSDSYNRMNEIDLHVRLEKLLSLESIEQEKPASSSNSGKPHLNQKISSSTVERGDDEWSRMLKLRQGKELSSETEKDYLAQELLKEKLHVWLLHKVVENDKAPSVLDKEGQGVIHLAAALGYDWAIEPLITAGVSINFRDVHGWTALHWAAFCGRERTVVFLVTLGAAAGALTDPTPKFPSGRTPADIASVNGHKGIAGFLAEFSLTSHLSTLTLKDSRGSDVAEVSGVIEDIVQRSAMQFPDGDMQGRLSLKDSLSAVRNATQAAARIHQVFRVESFHRKQLTEYGGEKSGLSDEQALSLISVKTAKPGQHDLPAHVAAIRIQNKFRGWKGRKDFLIMRQRIIKIQALVRGYQVRKHYRKIIWSVGIVEKAILRWRRKGCGLRGFRSEGLLEGPATQNHQSKDEDYDFFKEGRKQTEARLDKALARVKSMVQYPEARDQYRRLLTIVTELQESKVMQEDTPNESMEAADGDVMLELEEFLEDDMFLPTA